MCTRGTGASREDPPMCVTVTSARIAALCLLLAMTGISPCFQPAVAHAGEGNATTASSEDGALQTSPGAVRIPGMFPNVPAVMQGSLDRDSVASAMNLGSDRYAGDLSYENWFPYGSITMGTTSSGDEFYLQMEGTGNPLYGLNAYYVLNGVLFGSQVTYASIPPAIEVVNMTDPYSGETVMIGSLLASNNTAFPYIYNFERQDAIKLLDAVGFDTDKLVITSELYQKRSPSDAYLYLNNNYDARTVSDRSSFGASYTLTADYELDDGETIHLQVDARDEGMLAWTGGTGDMGANVPQQMFCTAANNVQLRFSLRDDYAKGNAPREGWKASSNPIPDSEVYRYKKLIGELSELREKVYPDRNYASARTDGAKSAS